MRFFSTFWTKIFALDSGGRAGGGGGGGGGGCGVGGLLGALLFCHLYISKDSK